MPMRDSDTILGAKRGSANEALAFARNVGSRRRDQVERYIREVYELAPRVGIDPAIVVAQSALETDNWRDEKWEGRLNPAGMGVTDGTDHGFKWPNGESSARGQIVHLWLYAKGTTLPDALADYKGLDKRWDAAVAEGYAGKGQTLAALTGKWGTVPDYGRRIANRSRNVFANLPDQSPEATGVQPHPIPGPHRTQIINGRVLWMVDQQAVAPKDIRPKEWADPSAGDAPESKVHRAGQPVDVRYVVVGADQQLWLVTEQGWRIPALAFVDDG